MAMTYKELYKQWKYRRRDWSKKQKTEKLFKEWIYDKIADMRGPGMW